LVGIGYCNEAVFMKIWIPQEEIDKVIQEEKRKQENV